MWKPLLPQDFPDLKQKQIKRRENIELFEKECRNKKIACQVYTSKHDPTKILIQESRFADLIIIDPETTFSNAEDSIPSGFIKEILSDAECPILVTPAFFEYPDEIIFCYDGTRASVYAMKHFSYIFPELNDKKITIATVKENEDSELDEKEKLTGWLDEHYNNYEFNLLHGMPEIELLDHLLHKKNAIIVMGAYGRNTVSQFFKHSHADLIIKTVTQPVFIAHS